MSVRSDRTQQSDSVAETGDAISALNLGGDYVNATITAAQNADSALAPANTLSTNHPDHPLKRTLVTNIRASLADLALRKTKGTWAPSNEALRSMLQSKKFVDLSGSAESTGDLKSIVLHSMTLSSVTSDFDVRKFRRTIAKLPPCHLFTMLGTLSRTQTSCFSQPSVFALRASTTRPTRSPARPTPASRSPRPPPPPPACSRRTTSASVSIISSHSPPQPILYRFLLLTWSFLCFARFAAYEFARKVKFHVHSNAQ
jgi:hypothetical protein